ncbi:MAG TPA: M23 family metallopeptidase [Acidimicrobiales bacterium]|nr:M23 family metallopeptidase [Acidimicrobiales bacterium]
MTTALLVASPVATAAGGRPAGREAQPPADNVFPVPAPHPVTFADTWHDCRDGCARRHQGNDLMAAEGTPLVAVEPGVIVRASPVDRGLGGVTLWLRGDSGVAYYYAHNRENLVVEGQRVARGQLVARVGRTGNARTTAPHVHFQVDVCGRTTSDEPCTVDPHRWLRSWSRATVADGGGGAGGIGGADGIGWYEAATGTFARRRLSGTPLPVVAAARPGGDAVPVAGDWDGDGRDALGLYRRVDATFALWDDEGTPLPSVVVGEPGRPDVWPVAGDFDGDGRDTVGLYRQAEASFTVLVGRGEESAPVASGTPGRLDAVPLVGDWDGDGRDSLGVYRQGDGAVERLDDEGAALPPPAPLPAGAPVLPVVGDWDGDGRDEVGVVRRDAGVAQLPQPQAPGAVRSVPVEGGAGLLPVAGRWDGDDRPGR